MVAADPAEVSEAETAWGTARVPGPAPEVDRVAAMEAAVAPVVAMEPGRAAAEDPAGASIAAAPAPGSIGATPPCSVIQRYSAGIQYCYGNELKRDATLRGKLVVALTVAASGDVVEATVVQNTVGSTRLAECALSQIRDWKFPAIPEGLTTFQAPFVFTPPN